MIKGAEQPFKFMACFICLYRLWRPFVVDIISQQGWIIKPGAYRMVQLSPESYVDFPQLPTGVPYISR